MIKDLGEKEFDSFIEKDNAVIDFGAEWCGPCKIMEPQFKKAAETMKNVKFGKVNIDEEYELASRFHVMSIPTTIFFKDGEVVDRHVGAMTADMIKRAAEDNFS